MADFLYKQESYKIRGIIFEIYKTLGSGHKEKVYQEAFYFGLLQQGFKVDKQKRISIYYLNKKIGIYIPDLIINDKILIELKAKPNLFKQDIEQFWHYLKNSQYKLGFLVNFGYPKGAEIIRRVYDTARCKSSASSALASA